jgi:hypothetical protein
MHELLLGVLLWIVPGKFVLVQPAAPVDKGNTEHFSAARHGRVCARASFRVANALAGFLSEDFRKYEHYFSVLLEGVGFGVSSRSWSWSWSWSRSRSLRWWCGSLQDGYGRDRDNGYTLRSESCRQGILDALDSLGGTRVRLAFRPLRIAENSDVRGRTRPVNTPFRIDKDALGTLGVRLAFLFLWIAEDGDVQRRR